MFLIGLISSCDDSIPDVGGAEQNYNDTYGLITSNTNLTTFTKAVQLAGLESTLSTGEDYTYFVPNNIALDAYLVSEGYVNDLGYPDINLVPVDDLKQLVLSHVVKGVKKRVGKLVGVEADYLETGALTTMANTVNPDLYLLGVDVTDGILKLNGSSKPASGLDYFGSNGFVNVLDNVISLLPPAPTISSLSQVFASPGDVITINGDNFVKVKSIKFNTSIATVVGTPTRNEIKVTVPADFDSYALIVVETDFGVSAPSGIGVKYLLYEDSLQGYAWDWGGGYNLQSTENVSRGTYSIKKVAEPWSGFFMGFNNALNTTDYQFVKLSVYSTGSTKIMINLNPDNGNLAKGTTVDLVPGKWNNLSIPISSLHPELLGPTFNSLFIQEFSGTPGDIFIDDIGFL